MVGYRIRWQPLKINDSSDKQKDKQSLRMSCNINAEVKRQMITSTGEGWPLLRVLDLAKCNSSPKTATARLQG